MKCKHLFSIIIVLLYSLNGWAQGNPIGKQIFSGTQVKHEIRFNLTNGIAGFPEINYERFITDNSGIGIAGALSLENKMNQSLRSLLLPYYRLYFGKGFASGFFIEGNLALASENIYANNFGGPSDYENKQFFGMGVAIGVKLLSRNGFVGEIYSGLGRLYGNTQERSYPRVGICLGKRW
jgi:hypothetical protein